MTTDTTALLRALAESQAERDTLAARIAQQDKTIADMTEQQRKMAIQLQQAINAERGTAPSDIRRHIHAAILIAERLELWPVLRVAIDAYQALGGHDPALDDDVYIALAEMRQQSEPTP